ncbi:hypothetical protein EDC01DRAFT_728623 [Geopyxis carbonaria]|nr:hypothetical protein EDC01DRAFT_728623 [Geopyxis carbonaria]
MSYTTRRNPQQERTAIIEPEVPFDVRMRNDQFFNPDSTRPYSVTVGSENFGLPTNDDASTNREYIHGNLWAILTRKRMARYDAYTELKEFREEIMLGLRIVSPRNSLGEWEVQSRLHDATILQQYMIWDLICLGLGQSTSLPFQQKAQLQYIENLVDEAKRKIQMLKDNEPFETLTFRDETTETVTWTISEPHMEQDDRDRHRAFFYPSIRQEIYMAPELPDDTLRIWTYHGQYDTRTDAQNNMFGTRFAGTPARAPIGISENDCTIFGYWVGRRHALEAKMLDQNGKQREHRNMPLEWVVDCILLDIRKLHLHLVYEMNSSGLTEPVRISKIVYISRLQSEADDLMEAIVRDGERAVDCR